MLVEFFRVSGNEDRHAAATALERIRATRLPDRVVEIQGQHILLKRIEPWGSRMLGDFIRIRMGAMPVRARLDGQTSLFELDDNEGIGEETAFLYDPNLQCLVLQRNRHGVSLGRVSRYLERWAEEVVFVDPILEVSSLQALTEMEAVRRVEVSIGAVDRANFLEGQGRGVREVMGLMESFRAPRVRMTLSMGHDYESSLLKGAVRNLGRFLRRGEVDSSFLRLHGLDANGEETMLNLLEGRMREHVEVALDGNRTFSFVMRSGGLKAAFQARLDELRSLIDEEG